MRQQPADMIAVPADDGEMQRGQAIGFGAVDGFGPARDDMAHGRDIVLTRGLAQHGGCRGGEAAGGIVIGGAKTQTGRGAQFVEKTGGHGYSNQACSFNKPCTLRLRRRGCQNRFPYLRYPGT